MARYNAGPGPMTLHASTLMAARGGTSKMQQKHRTAGPAVDQLIVLACASHERRLGEAAGLCGSESRCTITHQRCHHWSVRRGIWQGTAATWQGTATTVPLGSMHVPGTRALQHICGCALSRGLSRFVQL
jgi:hypothetical protein